MLQKQEQKQFSDLSNKEAALRDQQDKRFGFYLIFDHFYVWWCFSYIILLFCIRFEHELQALGRSHETDADSLSRQQRTHVERAVQQQETDLRTAARKLRAEQERELKHFRDGLKQEMRLLKQVNLKLIFCSTLCTYIIHYVYVKNDVLNDFLI